MNGEMAERLKQLRDKHNYKQEGMANAAGVSQRTWSTWEVDPPSQFDALRKLCDHFAVSADYLLGLTDDPRAPAERTGWDAVTVDIANKVMTLPAQRRRNISDWIDVVLERDEATRRADEAAALAEMYEEALQATATFIAGQKLVGEDLLTLRSELDRMLGAHGASIVQALAKQGDG